MGSHPVSWPKGWAAGKGIQAGLSLLPKTWLGRGLASWCLNLQIISGGRVHGCPGPFDIPNKGKGAMRMGSSLAPCYEMQGKNGIELDRPCPSLPSFPSVRLGPCISLEWTASDQDLRVWQTRKEVLTQARGESVKTRNPYQCMGRWGAQWGKWGGSRHFLSPKLSLTPLCSI